MQEVGHHLQVEAIKRTGNERDLFARSAYNRYYYAVFLDVRSMLTEFDPRWAQTPHKSYPDLLKGSIAKTFKKAMTRARKNSDFDLLPKLVDGNRAAAALAKLMEQANATRVVADYEPSEAVNFTSVERFSLRSTEITEAHNWGDSVRLWTNSIRAAWMQVNV